MKDKCEHPKQQQRKVYADYLANGGIPSFYTSYQQEMDWVQVYTDNIKLLSELLTLIKKGSRI